MLARGIRITMALCVIALSGCASGPSLSVTCSVDAKADHWTATFTNRSSSEIVVATYTALIFDAAGGQVASLYPGDYGAPVAGFHSYTDTENLGGLANATSCRVTDLQTCPSTGC